MWLEEQARINGDKGFINNLSFKTVYEQVEIYAGSLASSLGEAKRVAIWAHNSATMAMVLLALLRIRKEVVFLNVHLRPQEVLRQTQELAIDCLLLADDMLDSWQGSGLCAPFGVLSIAEILGAEPLTLSAPVDPLDQDIAVIMNTSATTGKFKSVPLSWGQIRAHVKASREVLGYQEDDNWLMVLPLFHVSGFSILMRSLYNGTAVTIHKKYDQDRVLETINSGSVNMVSLVPTILRRIMPNIGKGHRLRLILLGGEFIPDPLVDQALAQHLPVYKTYGMTETFSQCVTFSLLDHPDKKASVGKPLPGMTVDIRQADPDGVGQVWVEGAMLMLGYLGQDPLAGAFNTDDMGYLDQEGYLYIVNRRKDIIISGGENIYPKEIEDILYGLPFIKECALVPVEDVKWGQVPALFVAIDREAWESYIGGSLSAFVKEDDSSLGPNRLNRIEDLVLGYLETFLRERLAPYKIPKYYRLLETLPRNGLGKIIRKDLHL